MEPDEIDALRQEMFENLNEPSNALIMRVFRALQSATKGHGLIVTEDSFKCRLFVALWSCLKIHWENNKLRTENERLRRELKRIINQAETLESNLSIFVEFAQKEGIV